ncbi:MAG: hypothetical protein WA777_17195 [Rhodanobacter sp.]
MVSTLHNLISELEQDRLLDEPGRLRERTEVLDRLDAYFPEDVEVDGGVELHHRVRAIQARLEAVNRELYRAIRHDIERGVGQERLLQWSTASSRDERTAGQESGERYDYLDELISGILQFDEPADGDVEVAAEMVFYQPTPARDIFDVIQRAELTPRDVLIDLGSGLGHVPLLVSICTGARCIGIELEAAYTDCARHSADALNLTNVTFIQQDARTADFSSGTVFYLYTPFSGTILRTVLDALCREAAQRTIRICTLGPCTPTVAKEPWLEAIGPVQTDRIAIFRSRS